MSGRARKRGAGAMLRYARGLGGLYLWVLFCEEERVSAGPPDRVELIGAGSLGYGTGPSFG